MRFWIYWNDLVQGPFEVEELTSLRAFTTDLPVCQEGLEEWGPAAAVPELLPYFEVATAQYPSVSAPPPPPPPEPPHMVPLQGEFFSEPMGQQSFLDQNGSKHFSFRPVEDEPRLSSGILPFTPQTSPFRFAFRSSSAVELTPVLPPLPELPTIPLSDPSIHEWELGILEPEDVIVLEPREVEIRPVQVEPPVIEPPSPPVVKPPIPEPPPVQPVIPPARIAPVTPPVQRTAPAPEVPIKPAVQKPIVPPVMPRPMPAPTPTPTPTTPEIPKREKITPEAAPPARTPVQMPDFAAARSQREEIAEGSAPARLWPWIVITAGFLALTGWWMMSLRTPLEIIPVEAALPVPPKSPSVTVTVTPPVIEEEITPPPPVAPPIKHRVKKSAPKPVQALVITPLLPVVTKTPEVVEKPVATVPEPQPEKSAALPGLAAPAPAETPAVSPVPDGRGHEQEAIDLVLKQKIYEGKRSVSENAQIIIETLHEKELLHAADTGARLYQPDKLTWSALHEQGSRYRVYLNFVAWQANGERVMTRSDQFSVDLDRKTVTPLDDSTRHDFYDTTAMLSKQANPKATDIQTMLDGVDALNRHKLRAVILKSQKKKEERKKMQAELQAAEDKLQRQVVYFRTKYAEKTLQNLSKAFDFSAALKGK